MISIRKLSALACGTALLAGTALGAAYAQDTVRIGYSAHFNTGLPVYMAEVAPEIYEKHGIDVELFDMRGSAANCVAAILADSVDVCAVGTTAGTAAIVEGADLKVIAMLQGPVIEIHLSDEAAAKTGVDPEASAADRMAGLKGLDLVTAPPGTAYYVILNEMLTNIGLTMEDIRFRPLVDQVAMKEGLRNGTFESVFWGAGAFTDLVEEGSALQWISIPNGDFPEYAGLPLVTVYAPQTWIDGNADLNDRLHAAFVDAIATLKADPEKYSTLIKAEYYPDMPDVNWEDAFLKGVAVLRDEADVTEADWNFIVDLQEKSNPGADYAPVQWSNVVAPNAQAE